ncbi:MAG: hypothetical protein ACJ72U_04615 [Nitrososphaeraceae archaeon]|jgi:hypothetical protein
MSYSMILAYENKCAMCGKDVIVGDKTDNKNEKEQKQQNNSSSSTMIVSRAN